MISLLLAYCSTEKVDYFHQKIDSQHTIIAVSLDDVNRARRHGRKIHLQELGIQLDPNQNTIADQFNEESTKITKNLCYGGKDMSEATLVEKLDQFRKGPCSPTLLIPGILGTKLTVTIDCQTLKEKNGQRFLNCGWSSCSIPGLSPSKEYLLWVSLGILLTPITQPGQNRYCFGDLMQLKLVYDRNDKLLQITSEDGINVTWYGNTPETSQDSNCGLNAIKNLNGQQSVFNIITSQCAFGGYQRMSKALITMGYESGLTLQAVPYDFRYGINYGNTTKIIPTALCNLYAVTGKKAFVVTHSLGSLHTLSSLAFHMSKADKERCVRMYIPIGPPWMGVSSAVRNALTGDPSYFNQDPQNQYLSNGINHYQQSQFVKTSGGATDLFLRDTFELDKAQPWLQEVKDRIKYEANPADFLNKKIPLSWYPPATDICYDSTFFKFPKCGMHLVDFTKQHIFQIEGTKYFPTKADYKSMFDKYLNYKSQDDPVFQSQMLNDLYDMENKEGFNIGTLPAPGVDVSVIFTSYYDTQLVYTFDSDVSKNTSQNKFAFPKSVETVTGDMSVPTYAVLMPISRWIIQGNQGKKVKAVQFCGIHPPFGEHYESIKCSCIQNQLVNQIVCSHACMISDSNIVNYVIEQLTNKGKGFTEDTSHALKLRESDLQDIKLNCLSLGFVSVQKKYETLKAGSRHHHN